MPTKLNKLSEYAPLVLRLGIAFVFLWFGWSSLSNPEMWVRMVPEWTALLGQPETLVKIHGAFEILFGLLLFAGIWTRVVGLILLINLINTITLLSWGPTMARDITIAIALLSLVLTKTDKE